MKEPNDGGQAFPGGMGLGFTEGMTLRDHFAGQALQGIKSNPELLRICSDVEGMTQSQAVAHMAYQDADAMIEARKVKK